MTADTKPSGWADRETLDKIAKEAASGAPSTEPKLTECQAMVKAVADHYTETGERLQALVKTMTSSYREGELPEAEWMASGLVVSMIGAEATRPGTPMAHFRRRCREVLEARLAK